MCARVCGMQYVLGDWTPQQQKVQIDGMESAVDRTALFSLLYGSHLSSHIMS